MPGATTANGLRQRAHAPAHYPTGAASRLAPIADLNGRLGYALRVRNPGAPAVVPISLNFSPIREATAAEVVLVVAADLVSSDAGVEEVQTLRSGEA
jgi:hypothetical protein